MGVHEIKDVKQGLVSGARVPTILTAVTNYLEAEIRILFVRLYVVMTL